MFVFDLDEPGRLPPPSLFLKPTNRRSVPSLHSPTRCLFAVVRDRVGRDPAPSHADNQKRTDEGIKVFWSLRGRRSGEQGTYPLARECVCRGFTKCPSGRLLKTACLHFTPVNVQTRPSPPPALFGILFPLFLVFSAPPTGLPLLSSPSGDDKTRQSV